MNRTPVDGRVTRIEYRAGKFLPAYKEDANQNELNEIWIDHHGEPVVVRQIVGVLARRIVCRVVEGQTLARGERIGLMKFGSRMDVFLPARAELLVQRRRARRRAARPCSRACCRRRSPVINPLGAAARRSAAALRGAACSCCRR